MWYFMLTSIVGLVVLMVLLAWLRKISTNETVRSILDFLNGILLGFSMWTAFKFLRELGWLDNIEDALSSFLWLLGEEHVWKFLLMTTVETILFYMICKWVLIPILPFGSNFMMFLWLIAISLRFSIQRLCDACQFDGFQCLWAFAGTVFICMIATFRLLAQIDVFRCPNCHIAHRADHLSSEYIGDETEAEDYSRQNTSTDSGYNYVTETTTTDTGTKYKTYSVYEDYHRCNNCGHFWKTRRSYRKSYEDVPRDTTIEKKTWSW